MDKKVITVFCEVFDYSGVKILNNTLKKVDFKYKLQFIALTALVCSQLDKLGYQYKIPQDYCLIDDIEFDPDIEKNINRKIFSPYTFEKIRSQVYWKKFINTYWGMKENKSTLYLYFRTQKQLGLYDAITTDKKICKSIIQSN